MRRSFSIFLILTFALGPLSALADGSEDANLPACCRRNGAHHCAISMHRAAMRAQADQERPSLGVPGTCQYFPGVAAMFEATAPALTARTASVHDSKESAAAVAALNEAVIQSPMRAHATRGPPII